jgi:hypothetical protein
MGFLLLDCIGMNSTLYNGGFHARSNVSTPSSIDWIDAWSWLEAVSGLLECVLAILL